MKPLRTARQAADIAVALRRSRELLKRDGWTDAELRAHQHRRLIELVRHAKSRSPFYRALYRDLDVDGQLELEQLPVIDKAMLMANFDEVVTDSRLRLSDLEAHLDGLTRDERYLGRYRVTSTGGSTGRKGVFVADRDEWREYLAGLLRVNEYMGLRPRLPRRRRVATVAAARPLHVTHRMSTALDIGLHRMLRLDATTPVEGLVEPLNRHQPEFLYSYPSTLSLLAVEQQEGRLQIAPSTIVSSGETHTEDLERTIRAAWDVPWFQVYGTTEVPTLGAHCSEHTGAHLFEDLAIVEVVDEHDRPVPPGRPGHRLLVTNLVNHTQPLIRYAISDLVTAAPQPCPCGRPFRVLSAIEGRSDDILRLPAAEGEVAVHPLALRSPMAAVAELKQYRIVYEDRQLKVRAALRAGASPPAARAAIEKGLHDKLVSLGATPPQVGVELVERIEDGRDLAGKFKVIGRAPRAIPPERTVRRAEVSDAEAIGRLLHDFNSEYDDPTPGPRAMAERVRELLPAGDITVLLGGAGPDGLAVLRFRPALWKEALDCYLEELYVVPDRRGQGLGRALMEAAIELARREGARDMHLGTGEDDFAARALYESLGFDNHEGKPDGQVNYFYEREL